MSDGYYQRYLEISLATSTRRVKNNKNIGKYNGKIVSSNHYILNYGTYKD